ncbi:MAG: phospholipase D-like domain-containing anti-phage protein [Mariprofundaceae bacterium]
MGIRRFSSRTHQLDKTFLLEHLKGARSYKRIAGYFTSSLFEVAHEWIDDIPDVKIVCNVDINPDDLKIAQLQESKMIGRWNENAIEAEALLNRPRYRRLDEFLAKRGQVIRVAPDSICGFLHGKAGVIELADGRKLGFIGSMNETSSGWQRHYEILWEDDSEEGVAWIEEEFNFLWNAARPLPDAVIREVKRRGHRHEIIIEEIDEDDDIAPAALIESPMYRQGMSLQPWQQGFVTECINHYRNHGTVRLLLADEVGLGKTLSLGTAALTLCLLNEKEQRRPKPVIIFAPATLCEQWQTEMIDKLGIPCARWNTQKKAWWDHEERAISPTGHAQIAKCPLRIGIVSTGLMMRDSLEKQHLLGLRYALVILDEAHKARSRQGFGSDAGSPNELLRFMVEIAARSDHVLLGTATPIQTKQEDLWDLVSILHQGQGNFVLGNAFSRWHQPDAVLPLLSGEQDVTNPKFAWELLRSPLPLVNSTQDMRARRLYSVIRQDLGIKDSQWETNCSITDLDPFTRDDLENELQREIAGSAFFQRENPFVRHVVLRKRTTLEDEGLLKKIGVDIHPNIDLSREVHTYNAMFEGLALRTSEHFRAAYDEARTFGKAIGRRGRGSGFMKNLMEQRICSSIVAGLNTAKKLIEGRTILEEDDDQEIVLAAENDEERVVLERLIQRLEQVDGDPKLKAIIHYLEEEKWRDHGVIIFSQYYDTAKWVADALAERYREEAIGLYAGAGRSKLYQQGESVGIERETLKKMVAEHQINIMVATDAACEGLNLQTLGTLINVDLPWNPTKLEQRIGRIKRFGQVRDKVDMLNLVNEQTVDEKVYERLSERMRDRFSLFGGLPDTIKDEWIDDIETLGEKMDEYIDAQKQANGFDLRYNTSLTPSEKDWRDCASVLSHRDFSKLMSEGWR